MEGHYADLWHRIALTAPDRSAVVTIGGERLTFAEFDDAAGRLAGWLHELGVRRDDKVSILLYNRPEWLITFAGCIRSGIVPVSLNFRYRAHEIAALLDDSDSTALLYPASLADVVTEAVATLGRPIILLQVQDVPDAPLLPGALDFADYASREPLPYEDPVDGDFFMYTGGTTGAPKAAVWSTRQMLAMQVYNAYVSSGLTPPEVAEDAVRMATDPKTRPIVSLALSPYMHGTALTTVINTLLLGGSVVVLPTLRFDPHRAIRVILEEGVTRVAVAGDAIAIPLLEAAAEAGITELPALTSVLSSGMRFSDSTKERLHALAPALVITDILASTEGGAVALGITRSADDLPARFQLTPNTVVLDEALDEVQAVPGSVGRIAFTGGMPKGYYKDVEKTAANFVEIRGRRHIIAGDLVKVTDDVGHIELLGRGATVVNSGGEKVYPAEVEEALLSHPSVLDAIVYGLPDDRWGEIVAAAVAVADPGTASASDIIGHVGRALASYKKPRRLLMLTSLERTGSGKVNLAELRQRTADEGVGA